jgi:EAL domain-containing protein (putative c-di-GMP-specific phosphodiesterase class I)
LPEILQKQFDDILAGRRLTAVFQPVVELVSEHIVGYEALIRGPRGSYFERPAVLFRYAYGAGRAAELDWVCRAAAFGSALAAGLPEQFTLFVNVEPASLGTDCPPDLRGTISRGARRLNVVLELTERYLTADPAGILQAVRAARENGLGIAVDDVGAEPGSLSMMPLVRPDVIKLDLSLIQNKPDLLVARTVNGVLAEVERTNATILAEGVESKRHAATAHAMGASLGQGWLYGRPGPFPPACPTAGEHRVRVQRSATTSTTRFEAVTRHRPSRPATRQLLSSLSRHLEYRAADPAEPVVVVACFDDPKRLTAAVARRYSSIAQAAVMVAVFGVDMPVEPARRVRGQPLAVDDPLGGEWVVVVVGAHFGAALVAHRARPDPGGAEERPDDGPSERYDFAVTYERDLVIAAAHSLVQRVSAAPRATGA